MVIRRRFGLLFALCGLLAALILVLMPQEKTLGQIIKLIYLHGALSRAGMIGLLAAGLAGLVYIVYPRPILARWSHALLLAGWVYWTTHFVVSLPVTHLTWGPWIAWGEPRVTMTLQVIGAGAAVIAVTWLVQHTYFTAGANILLSGAFLFLVQRTGVLRHPLDPIGSSPSPALHLVYAALLLPIIGSMLLLARRWAVTPPIPIESRESSLGTSGGSQ